MAFNISDFLNTESKKQIMSDWKPVRLNIHQLRPAPEKENFYHLDEKEITELAASIELVGLQQYPVVTPITNSNDYMIIAGHKRHAALLHLVAEGKNEYEMVPCKVEETDTIKNELVLIFTNSTQRERSDYEKMKEVERVQELLMEYQKTHELTGRKQTIIADILGTSKTKVGTLNKINHNLIEPFKEEFAQGKIKTSTASEIASLSQDEQQGMYETYKETGSILVKDKEKRIMIDGQACVKVDEWESGEDIYLLGNSIEDRTFFYAEVNHKTFEYDYKPDRNKIEEDYLNWLSICDIDRHEAEVFSQFEGGNVEQEAERKKHEESPKMPQKPLKKEEVIDKVNESKKGQEMPTEGEREVQENLCETCVHNGECAGKKTQESGCMGYEQQENKERKGIEFDINLLKKMIEETEQSLKKNKEYWLECFPDSYTRRVMELAAYHLLLKENEEKNK